MANTNIQGSVQLLGPGLRNRTYGDYQPGEYKELQNVEVVDNGIRTRRGIVLPASSNLDYDRVLRFVGTVDNYAWAATETTLLPVGERAYTGGTPDSLSNLPDQAGDHYHHLVGFFKYNASYYWLTSNFDGTNVKWYIYKGSTINATFSSMAATRTLITTTTRQAADPNAYQYSYKGHFIFKERLFLVTHEGVYFSKSTDPMVWTVPDGGFFKIPDQEINAAIAVNDTVYMATNKAVHVFTYSVNPNSDGYMRPLTGDLGLWSLALIEGSVYGSNKYSLYTIDGGGVNRVADFEDIVPKGQGYYTQDQDGLTNKLVAFENYLYVIEYRTRDVSGEKYPLNVAYRDGNDDPNDIIVFDTQTGSVHKLDFEDELSKVDPTYRGRITDAIVSKPTFNDDPTIVFMTSKATVFGTDAYKNSFYLMDYPRAANSAGIDQIRDNGTWRWVKINQRVVIDSYTPDGNEHHMKKFRGLLGMAQLPREHLELTLAFDNKYETYLTDINNTGTTYPQQYRPHYPFRVRINQRANSITFTFRTAYADQTANLTYNYYFELSDLRVLWTYTARLTPLRNLSIHVAGGGE